jgi:hypothetical protein
MTAHRVDSQVTDVLEHLKFIGEINPFDALKLYGCYRLGAIIHILRGEGYNISTRIHHYEKASGKKGHYAIYRLEESAV